MGEIFRMAGVVYHGNWHAFLPADITGEMGRMGSCTRQSADPGGIQGGEIGSAGHRGVGENMDGTVGGFSERNGTGQRI